jgi:3-hydroxyacyl-[acyl-carrier-protein] dehydratase
MEADRSMRERVLALVPQRRPFRFIEEILELDEEHIVGAYRFRSDEYFYPGHFPGLPVTPGVILIETMAQTGVVAFGLYLNLLRGKGERPIEVWSAPVSSSGLRGRRFISAEISSRSTAL